MKMYSFNTCTLLCRKIIQWLTRVTLNILLPFHLWSSCILLPPHLAEHHVPIFIVTKPRKLSLPFRSIHFVNNATLWKPKCTSSLRCSLSTMWSLEQHHVIKWVIPAFHEIRQRVRSCAPYTDRWHYIGVHITGTQVLMHGKKNKN